MKVNLNSVATTIVIAAILSIGSVIYDFQNVKANVAKQDAKINMIYEDLKEVKQDVKSLLRRE